MSTTALGLLGALGVLVGLVGVLLPVVPGLLLVWGAAVGTLVALPGATPWFGVGVVTVLAVVGTVASLALPTRRLVDSGAPRGSLVAAGVGAVVGFFVVPVLGLLLGAVGGLLLAEQQRTGDLAAAWASSRQVIAAYGVGVLLELLAGVLMGVVWAITFVVVA